jgi:hypothetical protein
VDCTGDLAAGGTTTITITTTVTASAGTILSTTSTVDPNNTIVESNESNNTVTATTSVVAAPCTSCVDLVAGTVSAAPSPVTNGNNVTYNFAVTNVGDQPTTVVTGADPVEVDINLDGSSNNSSLVSVTPPPGWTCTPNSPPVPSTAPELVCTIASLAGGDGGLFSVTATANTPSTPSSVAFDVSVDPAHAAAEFNPFNNTSTLSVNTQ